MALYVDITEHTKVFLNEEGKEVYPPGHPYAGMVKPENERQRDSKLPPKSLAEKRMEIANEMAKKIGPEEQAAIELLKSKGIIK